MNTKRLLKITCVLAMAALALMLVPGCGGGDDDGDNDGGGPAQALNVAGHWGLTAEGIFPMTLDLTHVGTAVAGEVTDSQSYAVHVTGSTASPMGSTEGSRNVTLVVTYSDGQVIIYSGSVAGDNNSMNGSYTSNWGGTDSWSASR